MLILSDMINTFFKNKTFIVTGCNGGLGSKVTKTLLSSKSIVIGISRQRPKFNNKNFFFYKFDENLFEYLKKSKSKIDGIIFCHAHTNPSNKEIQSFESFSLSTEININLTYKLFYSVHKKIKNHASLIFITSIFSSFSIDNNPGYVTSKAAISGLMKALAHDLSSRKIRCNSIAPSYFKTNMTKKSFFNNERKKLIDNKNYLHRWGKINEVVDVIIYLLSNKSSFINGQEIRVDGGWSSKGL